MTAPPQINPTPPLPARLPAIEKPWRNGDCTYGCSLRGRRDEAEVEHLLLAAAAAAAQQALGRCCEAHRRLDGRALPLPLLPPPQCGGGGTLPGRRGVVADASASVR